MTAHEEQIDAKNKQNNKKITELQDAREVLVKHKHSGSSNQSTTSSTPSGSAVPSSTSPAVTSHSHFLTPPPQGSPSVSHSQYINQLQTLNTLSNLYSANRQAQAAAAANHGHGHPHGHGSVALQNVNLIQFNSLGQSNGVELVNPIIRSVTNAATNNSQHQHQRQQQSHANLMYSQQQQQQQRLQAQQNRQFQGQYNGNNQRRATIQLGCHRPSLSSATTGSNTLSVGKNYFLRKGVDVDEHICKRVIKSSNQQEMIDSLYIFLLLFERFILCTLAPGVNYPPTKQSRSIYLRLMNGLHKMKIFFFNIEKLTGFNFIEKFKNNYSLIWDDLLRLCGQSSPFIKAVNSISRSAFKMIKKMFMLHVFKNGMKPEIVKPVNISGNLFLSKVSLLQDPTKPLQFVSNLKPVNEETVKLIELSFNQHHQNHHAVMRKQRKQQKLHQQQIQHQIQQIKAQQQRQRQAQKESHQLLRTPENQMKRVLDDHGGSGKRQKFNGVLNAFSAPILPPTSSPALPTSVPVESVSEEYPKEKVLEVVEEITEQATDNGDSDGRKIEVEVEVEVNEKNKEDFHKAVEYATEGLSEKVDKIERVVENMNMQLDKLLSTAKFLVEGIEKVPF